MTQDRPTTQKTKRLMAEPKAELRLIVREDLYRAFMRCIWITVNETGLSPYEVQNMLIEELLTQRKC